MSEWKKDELSKIGNSSELRLLSSRNDGSLRKPVVIWVVNVNNGLYVRSVRGQEGKWYRHVLETHRGQVKAGGVDKDVDFSEVSDEMIQEEIDRAYQTKYKRYGDSIVGSTLTAHARAATLKLTPL